MAISISGTDSPSALSSTVSSTHTIHKAAGPNDTVTLSVSEQVHLLVQQGSSVSQIATDLSTSTAIVESYLGIQATAPALNPVPPSQPQTKNISISATSSFTKNR
jgi:hypothetical protein